jgi:hypothetical protein
VWADKDSLIKFGISEFWKLTAQGKETFTTFMQGFFTVLKPECYVLSRQKHPLGFTEGAFLP